MVEVPDYFMDSGVKDLRRSDEQLRASEKEELQQLRDAVNMMSTEKDVKAHEFSFKNEQQDASRRNNQAEPRREDVVVDFSDN